MTELDVINEMLATMGEAPLNQIEEDHPYVAAGKRFLSATNQRVQSRGWWFNTEVLEFVPDAVSKYIYVSNDIISAESLEGYCRYKYTQRGRRLYDLVNGSFTIRENRVVVRAFREIPFDDLPPLAQDAVSMSAVLRFQQNYDADQTKTSQLAADQADAMILLRAEDTRQKKPNFIYNTTIGNKVAAVTPWGSSRLPYPGIGVR